jgi:sugar lactone lactonase YvrE
MSEASQVSGFEGLMVHAQRAREAETRQDWSTARDEYLKALAQEPRHPIVLLRVARYEAKLGQAEAAIQHLNGAADLGATADLTQDLFFDGLRERDDFLAVNGRLADNGSPHEPAEVVVRFADAELWPEGIATDAATGDIYVGSFNRNKVVRVLSDGTVEDFGTTAADDLQSVVGVWVDSERRELWAATSNQATPGTPLVPGEVVRYDVETGELRARYAGPDDGRPQLINDVTVGPDGTAYITESLGGRIFRVDPGGDSLELFKSFPLLGFVNGIAISDDGSMLYFAHIEGLSAIDLVNGDTSRVTAADGSVLAMGDGLSWAGNGLVIVQNQAQLNFRVIHIRLDKTKRHAAEVSILPSGVPEGLMPFTSAVLDREVFVVATSDFALHDRGEVPPASVVIKMHL